MLFSRSVTKAPKPSPAPESFDSVEEVFCFARREMDLWSLQDWSLEPSRTVSGVMGDCHSGKQRIRLSIPHMDSLLLDGPYIVNIIRHEIAHALCKPSFFRRNSPHGQEWRACCALTGAIPRASLPYSEKRRFLPQSNRKPIPYKYGIRLKGSQEVLHRYKRKPKWTKRIKLVYLRGRPDTRGQLEFFELSEIHENSI